MPNWCYNEFHIEIEGGREDALEVVKLLSDASTAAARERLAAGNSHLREDEFPFEPLELVTPPPGMLDADPSEAAVQWRTKTYPEHGSGSGMSLQEQIMATLLQQRGKDTTLWPHDVVQADCSALNLTLFGHASAGALLEKKVGNQRAWEGRARIEEREGGQFRIMATVDSAWSPIGNLAPTLLQLSEKIREVRVFWIEQSNDFFGGSLADRHGAPITLDENACTQAYRTACEALQLPPPEPEEGEDWINVDYGVLFQWLGHRLEDLARMRAQPPSPSP